MYEAGHSIASVVLCAVQTVSEQAVSILAVTCPVAIHLCAKSAFVPCTLKADPGLPSPHLQLTNPPKMIHPVSAALSSERGGDWVLSFVDIPYNMFDSHIYFVVRKTIPLVVTERTFVSGGRMIPSVKASRNQGVYLETFAVRLRSS